MKKSRKQVSVLSFEKKDKIVIPIVKSPSRLLDERIGRGFSINEIKAASIPIDDFDRLGFRIDHRRRSINDANVEFLGKKYRDLISEELVEKEALDKIEKRIKDQIKNLSKIPSISKTNAKRLVDGGVTSIESLIEEDPASLAKDIGEKIGVINQWIKDAMKFKNLINLEETINNLCQLDILNKEKAKRLASIGIISIEILAEEEPSILAEDLGISEYLANEWIKRAKKLVEKTAKKKKEKAKRETPIVKAPKKPKIKPKELTLKDISGIGKKELQKLEDLEITTLKDLVEEDAGEISSIIGIGKDIVLTWINRAREYLGLPKKEEKKIKKKIPEPEEVEKIEIVEEIKEKMIDFSTLEEEIKEEIEEVEEEVIEKGVPEKKFIISEQEKKDIINQLNKIKGVGKVSSEKLINAGIRSVKDLIEADIQNLSSSSGIKVETIQKFIEEAKKIESE